MIKWFSLLTLVLMVTLTANVAFAQDDEGAAAEADSSTVGPMNLGAAVGAGLCPIFAFAFAGGTRGSRVTGSGETLIHRPVTVVVFAIAGLNSGFDLPFAGTPGTS